MDYINTNAHLEMVLVLANLKIESLETLLLEKDSEIARLSTQADRYKYLSNAHWTDKTYGVTLHTNAVLGSQFYTGDYLDDAIDGVRELQKAIDFIKTTKYL